MGAGLCLPCPWVVGGIWPKGRWLRATDGLDCLIILITYLLSSVHLSCFLFLHQLMLTCFGTNILSHFLLRGKLDVFLTFLLL